MVMRSFEFSGFIEADGKTVPFYLRISEPMRNEGEEDYFCRVHAPLLFRRDKDIYGTDQEQAYELAFDFVRRILANRRPVDKNGRPVKL